MIRSSVDRRHLVNPSGETTRHVGRKLTVNGCIVQALEEGEFRRVIRSGLTERSERLDDDVGMPDNLALRIELLRC